MRFSIALVAGLFVTAAADEAKAVTFTPDMWVYEVTLTLDLKYASREIEGPGEGIVATTSLPPGSTYLPGGDCYVEVYASSVPRLICEYETVEEALTEGMIDVFAEEVIRPFVVRIGFNETEVVMEGHLSRRLQLPFDESSCGEDCFFLL